MSGMKKRFIAGAICPKCKAQDRLVVYRIEQVDYRECVACGFKDQMHFQPGVREIQTRVNTSAEQVQGETQVVRLPGMDAD
jgi:uncharacterized metal-binding protein (TIGR02443 family)